MANSRGSNFRNSLYSGKHALLPPKSPYPSISPAYTDYAPSGVIGPKVVQKPRKGNIHHQRTSSESLLMEEQPSWLDDLLNEPETPLRRGHRRSSSDSYAYVDVINASNTDYAGQDEYRYKHLVSVPSWGPQDFDYHKDTRHAPFYTEVNSMKPKTWAWESPLNALPHSGNLTSAKDNVVLQNPGSPHAPRDTDGVPSTASEKLETAEAGPHDPKSSLDKKDNIHAKPSASDNDTKRAKQQFAQRSRVRKLQYIAELERNVQALQAEGTEVSAELEFLKQRNLILSMENEALKQRLESLTQEHLIKCFEHDVLEREIGRLRSLYQQQQPPPLQPHKQPSSSHRRTNSGDLDSQFANLSLKQKGANSGHDPATGPLRF